MSDAGFGSTPGTVFTTPLCNPANTDGSEVPAGILWDQCNATGADQQAAAVVRSAVVNESKLTFFSGATQGQITAAFYHLQSKRMLVARPAA